MICGNCGDEKTEDGFRACVDCREYWRLQQRKPTGNAYKLMVLEEKYETLLRQHNALKAKIKCVSHLIN